MRIRAFPAVAHVAVAAMLSPLGGCGEIRVLRVFPNYLTILPGASGVAVVEDGFWPIPDDCGTGRIGAYEVRNVPDGVSYSIDRVVDTSLNSPPVRITFDVAATAPPAVSTIDIRLLPAERCRRSLFMTLRIPPLVVPATAAPIAIAAGAEYSVAALADGTTWTWGSGRPAHLGLEARMRGASLPMMVPNLGNVRSVAAGTAHVLALTVTGDVWAWGENDRAQVGDRATLGDAVDVPARVPGVTNIQAIAAGAYHSLAVDSSGGVWTWGHRAPPARVPNLPPIRAVAAGRLDSFAVDVNGAVWRWTLNFASQPQQLPGLRSIASVSARGDSFIAVDQEGSAWLQGENAALIQALSFSTLPVEGKQIEVPLIDSSSLGQSNAAVTTRLRTVWEWGLLGDSVPSFRPVQVALPPARAVAASGHRLALLDCGALWSWGHNYYGQLGDGATGRRPHPMPVLGIGDDHDCPRVGLRVMVTGAPGVGDAIAVEPGPVEANYRESEFFADYERGVAATLRARPELVHTLTIDRELRTMRATFERWALDCAGTDPVTTIVLDRSRRCAAVYRLASAPPPPPTPPPPVPPPLGFTLTVVIEAPAGSPASVVGSMSGNTISCLAGGGPTSVCSQTFPPGATTQIRPGAAEGSQFDGWVSGCTLISGASRCTVFMNGDRTVIARFRGE